jgi:MYXO-CTERM domain-containing protein
MRKRVLGVAVLAMFVAVLATTFAAPADAGPVAWWKLDDGSGDTAVDSVGSYDGALVPGSGDPVWTTGEAGGALSFSATDGEGVDCGDIEMSTWTDLSVSAWINTSNTDLAQRRVVGKDQAGVAGNFLLWEHFIGTDSAWIFQAYDDTAGEWAKAVWISDSINDGEWHHLVGLVDSAAGEVKLYVDGAAVTRYTSGALVYDWTAATLSDGDNEEIAIGSDSDFDNGTNNVFDGSIDDVQIYDHALSAAQITYLFENPGEMATSSGSAVPEPAGLGVLGMVLLGAHQRRRRWKAGLGRR